MLTWWAAVALAYETDQLTWRERQLRDSTEIADGLVDTLLAEAIEDTNARTDCEGTDAEVRRVLAKRVHRSLGRNVVVMKRGFFRAPGYDRYAGLLELREDVDRFSFDDREDIFGELSAWQSLILAVAGPCSTYEVAGRRVGSDKFDHFFSEGFEYWVRSDDGTDPTAARAFGTATERSVFGLLTSKTFSFADLASNQAGYRFFAGLLEQGSVLQRDEDGCVEQVAPWRWEDWITDAWDEVLNPSIHTREVERGILERLVEERDRFCASWHRWDPEGEYPAHLATLDPLPPYVEPPIPSRGDLYHLDELCSSPDAVLEPGLHRPLDELRRKRRRRGDPDD